MPASKPFTRSGLHRLACPCGAYVYARCAQLEAHGMPMCPACLHPFEPERLELALELGLDTPAVQAWQRRTGDKTHSQTRSLGGWQKALARQGAGTLNRMDTAAFDEIVAEQRQQSRARRLAAIAPTPEPMPF